MLLKLKAKKFHFVCRGLKQEVLLFTTALSLSLVFIIKGHKRSEHEIWLLKARRCAQSPCLELLNFAHHLLEKD